MDIQSNVAPKNKLLVQMGTPVFLFAFAVSIIFGTEAFISFQQEKTEALNSPQTILRSADREIVGFFKSLESDARIASASAAQDLSFSKDTQFFLQNIVKENTTILKLEFFDEVGERVIDFVEPTARDIFKEEKYTGKYYFDTIKNMGQNHVFEPYLSTYDTPIVTWSFPVRDSYGELRGVMNVTADISALWVIISSYREANFSEVYIIDDKGVLLVSNDFANIESRTSLLTISGVEEFIEGKRGVMEYIGIEGVPVAGIAVTIPSTSWYLVSEVNMPKLLQDARNKMNIPLFFLGVLLLLFLYELYKFNRVLIEPITSLTETAELVAEGNLSERAVVVREDEVGNLAKAFNSMFEKLEVIDRAKSEFISIAAHQLRAPITEMRWTAESLAKDGGKNLDEKQKQQCKQINKTSERAANLINKLLNITNVESKSEVLKLEEFSLSELINSSLEEVKAFLQKNDCGVIFSPDKSKSYNITTDKALLSQVFENVISNAVQYSDGVCEAVIEIDVKEGGYEVRVSDKGIGIPKNEQKHVFEKFYRSEEAIKKEAGNVGLGLYLVKSIVNILGGEIRFESVEGEGTTFFITLPKAVSK